MKQMFFIVVFAVFCIQPALRSQSNLDILTPNSLFDTLYDNLGNKYPLANLSIGSGKPLGGYSGGSVTSISGSCNPGYFTLYFDSNSVFSNTLVQIVACQVFQDISNFINSNVPAGTIKVYCGQALAGNLADATSLWTFPQNPINPNQGFIDPLVYMALASGTDPYNSIPINFLNNNNTGFYHLLVGATSFSSNNSLAWNTNLSTTTIAANEYDLYSALLHEAMHGLGIFSLMDYNGFSYFGSFNNYFSRYDRFLYDHAGNPLLTAANNACPTNSISFAPTSNTVLSVNSATWGGSSSQDVSTCTTAAKYIGGTHTMTLYTPPFYERGSSLSHFEDACMPTSGVTVACMPTNTNSGSQWNNLYYSLCNLYGTGSCYVKRHITGPEQTVLCDLGYSVNAVYGSSVAGSTYTYNSACTPTMNLYGFNDGYSGNMYTIVVTGASTVIPHNILLSNDIPTGSLSVSCMELISGSATLAPGSNDFTLTASSAGVGVVVLKYYPVNSSGQLGNVTYVFIYFIPLVVPHVAL